MEPVMLQMRFPILGALRFSWFYWEKFTILRDLRAPGTHFGDPGLYFEDFFDLCDLEDTCVGKAYLFLTSKCDQKSIFFTRIFSMFLECSVLEIFGDFLHLRAHFGSHFNHFLWEMGFRKNSWKCVIDINFRGLTPPKCCFFANPNDGCFLNFRKPKTWF